MLLSAGYRGASVLLVPFARALLARRLRRGKEEAARLGERMGRPGRSRPDGPLIWIHGASVGEAMSALPLIGRLLADRPALHVLVTSGTVTSAALMAERLPDEALHQYVPVDCAPWVERFLDHWRPDAALWLESELWPNLVLRSAARGVPLALVNARMSARSHRAWRRWPGSVRPMLRAFRAILAQSEADAGRFRDLLGSTAAAEVSAPGNLKLAAAPLPAEPAALDALRAAIVGRPVWLAASTHPGEEMIVAAVHRALAPRLPGLLTIIVPRHPGRGAAIAAELRASGHAVTRRGAAEPIASDSAIHVADTLGELGLFYRAVDIVLLGGSLVPHGGHNPVEPAQLGCALLWGPHMENFSTLADRFVAAGAALTVPDPAALESAVLGMFGQPAQVRTLAEAGLGLAAREAGVLDAILARIDPLLGDLGRTGTGCGPGPEGHDARA